MLTTPSRLRIVAVFMLLAWVFAEGQVWARGRDRGSTANKFLQEAKILYDNLQYRDALKRLKSAIRVKGNTRSDIVEIYKYLGFIYIIQGHKKHAHRAFELLLKVNPNYEMNPLLTSPKILNFFNRVKDSVRKKDKVIMRHQPLAEVNAADRIELLAYVVDIHKKLREMKIYYRRRGQPEYSAVQMTAKRQASKSGGSLTYVGYIPFIWNVYDEVELFVDYYIAGVDAKGRWVANAGNPKQPNAFRVNLLSGKLPEGARKTPLVKSWWFWTLIGVGAAGLATGIYFIADSVGGDRPEPDTGEAILILR